MAQIVTITNPLTGQPAQVDQLDHTAQQIDDGIGFESTDYPGCYYRTVDGVVEWLNPPMFLGVEYRTTERYLGRPVYAQIVNFGTLPNVSTKKLNHNIQNISSAIAVYGQSSDQALIVGAFSGGITAINADNTQIIITTSQNLSDYVAYVAVKYTKTTD